MDENNKDKLINKGKEDADELMEETFVFKRESDDIVVSRQPAVKQRSQPQSQAQKSQAGGAVIRPLKPSQPNRPIQQTVIKPMNNSQAQRPEQSRQQVQGGNAQRTVQANAQNQGQYRQPAQNIRPNQTQYPNGQVRQQRPSGQNQVNRPQSGGAGNVPPIRTASNRANQPDNLPVRRSPMPAEPRNSNRSTGLPSKQRAPEVNNDWAAVERQTARRNNARDSASSAIMSAVKAVVYIVFVIAVSVPLSIFVINTANDVFAFKKEEKIIEVTIPEYTTIEDLGDILGEAGIIKYPWAFKLWTNIKEKKNIENGYYPQYVPGTYEVNTNLNYDYLRATFRKSTKRETVTVMIPEGYTVDEIIDLLVANGVSTRDELVDAINNYPFEYRFIEELTVSPDRFYRLEGYLFPDTYEFYKDSSAVTAIDKLLQNFNKKFIDEYYDRCTDLGLTVDQAITLASMIEKEARYAADLGDVSSVFHNRLNYSKSFPYLNSDATVAYAMQHDSGKRPDTLTGEDMEYVSPYNTYTNKGLPPGPIANPGLNSIRYALYPNETKYFYFVSDSSGHMLFAETAAKHEENIRIARSR